MDSERLLTKRSQVQARASSATTTTAGSTTSTATTNTITAAAASTTTEEAKDSNVIEERTGDTADAKNACVTIAEASTTTTTTIDIGTTTTDCESDHSTTTRTTKGVAAAAACAVRDRLTGSSANANHRRKELFGDCALVEIIHLHDCLRGALKALEVDVCELSASIVVPVCSQQRSNPAEIPSTSLFRRHSSHINHNNINKATTTITSATGIDPTVLELERRVTGRFKVIWSVFQSHSAAEDEFIWPALSVKTEGRVNESGVGIGIGTKSCDLDNSKVITAATSTAANEDEEDGVGEDVASASTAMMISDTVQEEYEEDHADEERMFVAIDALLTQLRAELISSSGGLTSSAAASVSSSVSSTSSSTSGSHHTAYEMSIELSNRVRQLVQHLHTHLEKEETKCLPLVVNHMTREEIHELVGNIMGKRSADTIAHIMNMAVQNLPASEREEMMRCMKQSMAGTFFDRWLQMSGWVSTPSTSNSSSIINSIASGRNSVPAMDEAPVIAPRPIAAAAAGAVNETVSSVVIDDDDFEGEHEDDNRKRAHTISSIHITAGPLIGNSRESKRQRTDLLVDETVSAALSEHTEGAQVLNLLEMEHDTTVTPSIETRTTTQKELENLIRAVALNASLTSEQKSTTMQGLRDSVWKLNQRVKEEHRQQATIVNAAVTHTPAFLSHSLDRMSPTSSLLSRTRSRLRLTPPSSYYRKNARGKIELAWRADSPTARLPDNTEVPLFSAAELAPTYHDGAAGSVLGCPHYARACKLRHPKSGRLYTCRLCCQQQREIPTLEADEPLDRYEVTEVMCMKCNTLQPAEDRCINPECELRENKPFARYFCRICHLYDDGSRPIFHCPYCNICKVGLGLGLDFRHCMRCNACVSLSDTNHRCIPQKLQGDCPICHESLFQSTEPLRGLNCGHVMHLSCFTDYRRGHSYTCPLCMRSMEDMSDYFSILDAAVRMQPMPPAYLATMSNIYCQDCGKTGKVPYHFVGGKCPHCGSYNTREMGRVNSTSSFAWN